MTFEMWFTVAVLVAAIFLFVTEWLRVDVVAFTVLVALMMSGVLTTKEALAGFSNSVVLTILALFIVGGAVLQTGLASMLGERILKIAGTNETRLMMTIMLAVALLSGFMSDTGTVAVLLPAVIAVARTAKIGAGKLLMPLSIGALVGGAMTLIGTPPNIYVSDLLRENGEQAFSFFSYTPVGIFLLIGAAIFMLLVGRHLLPNSKPEEDTTRYGDKPNELLEIYLAKNIEHGRVSSQSPLIGKSVAESGFHHKYNIMLVEILRPKPDQSLVALGGQKLVVKSDTYDSLLPSAETSLQRDDILVLQGDAAQIEAAKQAFVLKADYPNEVKESLINDRFGIAEVILRPRSRLVGKTLKEARFGSVYHLTVLDIARPGVDRKIDVQTERLQYGDTLLVQGYWQDILGLRKKPHDFILMGDPEETVQFFNRKRAPIAGVVLFAMLVAFVFGEDLLARMLNNPNLSETINAASISMTAALAMILTGCISMDEAYEAIDWKSIILIAGMIPMSTALQKVGLAELVANGVTYSLGAYGPYAIMAGLFLITSLLTQVTSNTATTVILAPIGYAIALQYGVRPQAFVMTVAIAASMAFATPVASPVNTLVMGAGSYKFRDYLKIGIPLIFVMLIITLIGVPIMFPFE